MPRLRIVGPAFGALMVAAACASAPVSGGPGATIEESAPRGEARRLNPNERDSLLAQAVADREGPGASISAMVSSVAGSRRVRASFHLDNDAYVVIGHIDADGIVRIAFPADPADDGFVRGNNSYQTNEFFAGFRDEYRVRARDKVLLTGMAPALDSYDGGLGYVFVIASWRPMRIDQFSTNGKWDTFELADQDYFRDPRPAIHELASILAGDNREAYTVKFARYFNTIAMADYSAGTSAFGYCSGFAPLGFLSSPFGAFGYGVGGNLGYQSFAQYGYDFTYRGSNYFYDGTGDCYRSGLFGFPAGVIGNGFAIAQGPVGPAGLPRTFDLDGHRSPPTPLPLDKHHMPSPAQNAQTAVAETRNFSPEYRRRGLIAEGDANGGVPVERAHRLQARVQPGVPTDQSSRPSIQEMINRRGDTGGNGPVGGYRARVNDGSSVGSGYSSPGQMARPRNDDPSAEGRSYPRASADGASRPAPVDRAQAPARSEPARIAPPSAPPAAPAPAPAPAPAASSASSSGKPPVPNI